MKIKFSALLSAVAVAVLLISLFVGGSVAFMTAAVSKLETSYLEREELKQLGLTLAAASDYLTDQCRLFVVSTDMQHLQNYWQEIEVTKRRDLVLNRLKELKAPQVEFDLIDQAKMNSDALVQTETRAMRLVLEAKGVGERTMHPAIAAFQLKPSDRALSPAEKIDVARRIMFDRQYEADKAIISEPVVKFHNHLDERSKAAVDQARARTNIAVTILVLMTLLIFVGFSAVLLTFHRMVGMPVRAYIRDLQGYDPSSTGDFALELKGIVELQQMATALNEQFKQNRVFQDRQRADLVRMSQLATEVTQNANQLNQASVQLARASTESDVAVQQVTQAIQSVAGGANHTRNSVQMSSSAIAALAQAVQSIASGADEQTREVLNTTSTVEQMASHVTQVAETAQQVAETSLQAKKVAEQGFEAVQATRSGMTEIQEVVSLAAGKVEELGQLGERIGAVVETIDDIAEQTNLLALNAAIEAARAGEHGRGFSVVADEVRKLAERSQGQTKSIADLIRQVQQSTAQAVSTMTQGRDKVAHGAQKAEQAGRALTDILDAVASTVTQVEAIALAAREMADASRHLVSAMNRISAVAERSASATNAMAQQSGQVRESIQVISAAAEDQSAAAEQMSSSADEMAAQMRHMATQAKELETTAYRLEELVAQFHQNQDANAGLLEARPTDRLALPQPLAALRGA